MLRVTRARGSSGLRFSDVVWHASEQSSQSPSLPARFFLGGAGLLERAASNGVLASAGRRLRFRAEFRSRLAFAKPY
jgi:hypothetical protein